ncbi:hypothetical protein [Sphingobium sp. CCH11-B1]|uniref:hypothetical protein n=1 Tax=Sphingobium sp. CCH11-B1 TaxID=1768781 RepID=UPI00082A6AFF|nr:hypothetical protein [Sphingobium sp. CCH11-B1]
MQFLENPQKLWLSEHIDDKRAAIKLTFAERLIYERGRGYRTTLTTSPFRVISNFDVEKCGMVRVVGIEPTLLSEPDFEFRIRCYDGLRQDTLELEYHFFIIYLSSIMLVPAVT